MGRGRAKAKQQKVARELKYSTHNTDFGKLQEELGRPGSSGFHPSSDADESEDSEDGGEDEPWASNYR